MARHRQPATASAAAAQPSLLSLPDDVLVKCLQHLPQDVRLQRVALVNKRLSGLCVAPQLLQTLQVTISEDDFSEVVRRMQSLLAFLAAHARNVRSIELDVELPEGASTEQHNETAALVTGCLTACAAAGGALEALHVSADTPLATTAWLAGLSSLQALEGLGNPLHKLQLPPLSKLTSLKTAKLCGKTIQLGHSGLPASLTDLQLEGARGELPPLGSLNSLQSLFLYNCNVSPGNLDQLAALPLRKLDIGYSTLPACLSKLTGITCLAVSGYSSAELERLDTALVPLSGLRTLVLSPGRHDDVWRLPTGVTALHSLNRFLLQRAFEPEVAEPPLPGGAWLASVQWLGPPYRLAAAGAADGVLSSAGQLEYFCSLGWPEPAAGKEEPGPGEGWDAFWAFLEQHPPLRCFAVDPHRASGSGSTSNTAAVDALFDLRWQRPGLQQRRVGRGGADESFWAEVLECDGIPEGGGA